MVECWSSMSSSSSSSSSSPRCSPTPPCPGPLQVLCPFIHQVGGHFPMVCLDERTLCKPLNEREHAFYCSLPRRLKPFVPLFHGVMVIEAMEDSDGYIVLRGTPPRHYRHKSRSSNNYQQYRLIHRDSIEIEAVDRLETRLSSDSQSGGNGGREANKSFDDSRNNSSSSHENVVDFYNPWALKCHRDHLKKSGLIRDSSSSNVEEGGRTRSRAQKYLLLENLVARFTNPCILDLKIGMRQYSDEVSEEKKRRKMQKSSSTTSSTLGLRLSGMQVFNRSSDTYICHNKYFGRTLNEATFTETLREFLSPSGHNIESSLVQAFLEKASALRDIVATLDSFRFYTCSLLLTFDGSQFRSDSGRRDVNLRVIDFAHATHREMRDSKTSYEGPDEGFMAGLTHLIRLLSQFSRE